MNSESPMVPHVPVLLKESIELLDVRPGGMYVDCTLGAGGHSLGMLQASSPGGRLLGVDADPRAIREAQRSLAAFRGSFVLCNDNFVNLRSLAASYGFMPVNGVLFDLGMSSMQLEEGGRGFSFRHDDPLDMRFSPDQSLTAADIVNSFSQDRLAHILETYGEEFKGRTIAKHIVKNRPLRTTSQLAELVVKAIDGHGKTHPATKTFQALRIFVNNEMSNLESALRQALDLLGHRGRLAVISYHSLEDRIVKTIFQGEARDCICPISTPVCMCDHRASVKIVTKKVVVPSLTEIRINPRSRSAKLRVAEKL